MWSINISNSQFIPHIQLRFMYCLKYISILTGLFFFFKCLRHLLYPSFVFRHFLLWQKNSSPDWKFFKPFSHISWPSSAGGVSTVLMEIVQSLCDQIMVFRSSDKMWCYYTTTIITNISNKPSSSSVHYYILLNESSWIHKCAFVQNNSNGMKCSK